MPKKEEYEKTKISPLIFAVLLIIVLLMFAIGRMGNKDKTTEDNTNKTTTTTTVPIKEVVADENQKNIE